MTTPSMSQEEFEKVFEGVVDQARRVLVDKAREYASNGNRLHNFIVAGQFLGTTPEQALLAFAAKHFVSLSDMVRTGDIYPPEVWDEKLGDALNYLILLRAQVYASEQARDGEETVFYADNFPVPDRLPNFVPPASS